jgi:hypothetical protein
MTDDVCDFCKGASLIQEMYVYIVMGQGNGIKQLNHM